MCLRRALAWTRIDVRDGEKGPLVVEVTACRVQAKADGKCVGPEELFVVIRRADESGAVKHDYYLNNVPPQTPWSELARVAKAEHRIEKCIQRGKSDCGLADYGVRSWCGWYHHQTLSLLAAWFLNCELRAGKKSVPAFTFPQLRAAIERLLRAATGCDQPTRVAFLCTRRLERNQLARYYHHKRRKCLAPLESQRRRF